MTNAEVKTLRESLGLSVAWLSRAARVDERTVRYWESGHTSVPADVAQLLAEVNRMLNLAVDKHEELIFQIEVTDRPDHIVMLRYRTNEDLWRFQPEFREMGLPATCHAAMLARLIHRMERRGQKVTLVYMEPEEYLAWLGKVPDSSARRAAWAGIKRWQD